ncbi:hypothetical protein HID58_076304 [Brassica napus]|uniref:RNase H type-1 domain-containing protein n=1 Tax=Brassica napus TaxID=3708 RepID=A0ABQ7YM36_BRANA|nr:hypothetical protein HID58_076304 [Brassica napus]
MFVDDDVSRILNIRPAFNLSDRLCWAFTRDGSYSSQSESGQSSEVGGVVSQIMGSFQSFNSWSMEYVHSSRNKVAMCIAASVTEEGRYQSYIANNNPHWLLSLISQEAENVTSIV